MSNWHRDFDFPDHNQVVIGRYICNDTYHYLILRYSTDEGKSFWHNVAMEEAGYDGDEDPPDHWTTIPA